MQDLCVCLYAIFFKICSLLVVGLLKFRVSFLSCEFGLRAPDVVKNSLFGFHLLEEILVGKRF